MFFLFLEARIGVDVVVAFGLLANFASDSSVLPYVRVNEFVDGG